MECYLGGGEEVEEVRVLRLSVGLDCPAVLVTSDPQYKRLLPVDGGPLPRLALHLLAYVSHHAPPPHNLAVSVNLKLM